MREGIQVNGEMLRWARESIGLSIDEVVAKLKRKRITNEVVEKWEINEYKPTYVQLERLAYEVYKRPLAIFFFPEPPEEISPEESFRTLPEIEIEKLPSRIRLLMRKAYALQINLRELFDGRNPAKELITNYISFKTNETVAELANEVRQFLGVSLEEQKEINDAESAFKFWRNIIEDKGVFVFKDAFRIDGYSGFCLFDDEFPVIYINNTDDHSRQIFTIFHELSHLLFKTGGIDLRQDDFISILEEENKAIEITCNRFAGEFLVPNDDFLNQINDSTVTPELVSWLADSYNVSLTVIYRKLLDNGFISNQEYSEKTQEYSEKTKGLDRSNRRGNGGDYYKNMKVYLGLRYIETVFSRFYQNRINRDQLAEYLGVKQKYIDGMENLLHTRRVSS